MSFGEFESREPRYRPKRRGQSGSFWIVGLVLLVLAIGGGAVGYFVLYRAGAIPGSEYEAAIRSYLEKNLNDPTGYEIVEVGKPYQGSETSWEDDLENIAKKTKSKPQQFTYVEARIRAKTPLGGKVLRTYFSSSKMARLSRRQRRCT